MGRSFFYKYTRAEIKRRLRKGYGIVIGSGMIGDDAHQWWLDDQEKLHCMSTDPEYYQKHAHLSLKEVIIMIQKFNNILATFGSPLSIDKFIKFFKH